MQYEPLVSLFGEAFVDLYGPLALSNGAIWLDFVMTYLDVNILIRTVNYGFDIFCPKNVVDALLLFLSDSFQLSYSDGKIAVYSNQLLDAILPKVDIKCLRLTYSTNVSHIGNTNLGSLFDTQSVFSHINSAIIMNNLRRRYEVNIGRSIGSLMTDYYFDGFDKRFKKLITPKEFEWSDISTIEYSITIRTGK
jgi:hypothetical protein